MDQINFVDSQDKIIHFGIRCSLILDLFSLRNEPYETPSHSFCIKSMSGVEYKFVVKVYKDVDYRLKIYFLGDYNEEDFQDLEFFYMIFNKIGQRLDSSSCGSVKSVKVSSKYEISVCLMSDADFKDWIFAHKTPLVLVFYILDHSPAFEKIDVLTNFHSSTECSFSTDFSNLYEKGDLSDFNIVIKNKTFNVHKCVLAARSTVFTKYFEENENNHDSITLDVNSDVVEEMLRFIYTNSVDKIADLAYELYNVAKEYDLRGLKEKCVSHMAKDISVDNAMRLLHFAKKHDENILLEKVTTFFVENTEQILASKATDEFLKPLLDLELSLSSSECSN